MQTTHKLMKFIAYYTIYNRIGLHFVHWWHLRTFSVVKVRVGSVLVTWITAPARETNVHM